MSQTAAILQHLRKGKTLTALQAYKLCGTLAAHSRIAELRERGHNIVCELERIGKRVISKYRLHA